MALKDAAKKPIDVEHLREMTLGDLEHELQVLKQEQFTLKFRSATEDVTDGNPMQFRTIRRNIARLKTAVREKRP